MSKYNSEDAQPNEIRFTRKGNTVIPAIQPTYPKGPQNPSHPRPGYRPTNHYANSHSFVSPPLFSNSRAFPVDPTLTHKHPGHSHYSTTYKRRRIEESSVRASQQNPAQLIRAPPRPQVNPARIEITVDLPIHCRHRVAGNNKSRRDWLNREIPRVEKERGVKIDGHAIGDSTLRFFAHVVGSENFQNTAEPGDCRFVTTYG
jgi:hypothetical protein